MPPVHRPCSTALLTDLSDVPVFVDLDDVEAESNILLNRLELFDSTLFPLLSSVLLLVDEELPS